MYNRCVTMHYQSHTFTALSMLYTHTLKKKKKKHDLCMADSTVSGMQTCFFFFLMCVYTSNFLQGHCNSRFHSHSQGWCEFWLQIAIASCGNNSKLTTAFTVIRCVTFAC